MAVLHVILTVAVLVIIVSFSIWAGQVEQSMWRSCRRRCNCLHMQRKITLGKSHCR